MKWVAATFAILPLALAACGAARTASPSPPREQTVGTSQVSFAQQASGICRATQRGAVVVSTRRKPTTAEFGLLLTRWRTGFAHLARLDPPAARVKPFKLMLRNYRAMVTAFQAAKDADDESVLADLAAAVVEGRRGSREAERAGLRACAFFPAIRQPPRDPESTLAATRALVLPGARVVKADAVDCNRDASCRIEFRRSGSIASRLRAARATLRAHGWTHVRTGRAPMGTTWAIAYRNDLEVEIELLGKQRPPQCAGAHPDMFGCSDAVWVHRVEIPKVLTGGS
jgi:hypothetical protein